MDNELRTDFTTAERNTIIRNLRDEYGDQEFSDELILLECQDLWRKGCHCLENECFLPACDANGGCGLNGWEDRNPEYFDDTLAKRLKELKDELRAKQRAEIEKSLLAKGYIKVKRKQFNKGGILKSDVHLYLPGSKDLMVAIAAAIENWKDTWGEDFVLKFINLNAPCGKLLDLRTEYGDEYEIWEVV